VLPSHTVLAELFNFSPCLPSSQGFLSYSLLTRLWPSSFPLTLWVPLHSLLLNYIFLSKNVTHPVPFTSGYLVTFILFVCFHSSVSPQFSIILFWKLLFVTLFTLFETYIAYWSLDCTVTDVSVACSEKVFKCAVVLFRGHRRASVLTVKKKGTCMERWSDQFCICCCRAFEIICPV
jgi:hypothetical protein